MRSSSRTAAVLVLVLVLSIGGLLAACSDSTNESLKSAATQVGNDAQGAADVGGARAAAEAFRGLVKTKISGTNARTITVLQDAQSQTPGGATFSGIVDTDGDGLDDDGYVQVSVADRTACVTLPASGGDTTVANDACPAS